SIHSHQLIVTNDSKRTVYDLPEDEFFVSIAPFVDTTHPCAIHSLTGCQGEMADEEFEITIEDQEGRRILDQQKVRTMENGFIDLWLPRNRVYEVTIRQGDRTSQAQISTFKNDNTCITTMQLI